MKIHYDLEKERLNADKLVSDLKKNPKSLVFLDVFDKAMLIELLHDSLEKGKSITIKVDEDSKDYPNILDNQPPRLIVQDNGVTHDLTAYLKQFGLILVKEKNEYFLTIKRVNDDKLDLKLKLDTDRTIDLKLLSENKSKNEKVFFGIKSYYLIKKK